MTLRQVLQAERAHSTAPFMLDSIEINAITTVAHLVTAEPPDESENRYYARYMLEDGSGQVKAMELFSDDHPGSNLNLAEPFVPRYVRVQGRLDQFPRGSPNSIKVSSIRECTDPHEYFVHFLECCAVTMASEMGTTIPSTLPTSRQSAAGMEDTTVNDISAMRLDEPSLVHELSPRIMDDPLSCLDNLQRGIILAMLNSTSIGGGMHVGEIAQAVNHLVSSPEEIGNALDYLADEGYIDCPTPDILYCVLTAKCRRANGHYSFTAN